MKTWLIWDTTSPKGEEVNAGSAYEACLIVAKSRFAGPGKIVLNTEGGGDVQAYEVGVISDMDGRAYPFRVTLQALEVLR